MKKLNIKHFIIFFITLLTFQISSCKKEKTLNSLSSNEKYFENSKTVTTTFLGQVIDEYGLPVINAKIRIGNTIRNTDSQGVYYFNNIITAENATVIIVEKSGYYKGVRTVSCTKNQDVYSRIRLMSKQLTGSFNSMVGGKILTNGNSSIDFEANSIMNDISKNSYTGVVNVFAHWIDPNDENINELVPGDLRGVTKEGFEKILTSYGMMAVELEDANGNKLQLANGKSAKLTMPIPSIQLNNSPNEIPLWSINEKTGMWHEEGNAKKIGNEYVGEVSHFSFWNCDYPDQMNKIEFTVVDKNKMPIVNAEIKITEISRNITTNAFTNSNGYCNGFVPKNSTLKIEIFSNNCTSPILLFSNTFTSNNLPLDLGKIEIKNTNENYGTIKGTLLNCENNIISKGFVSINNYSNPNYPILIQPNGSGEISTTVIVCNNTNKFILKCYDDEKSIHGKLILDINKGENNLGDLFACGIPTEFINYIITENSISTECKYKFPIFQNLIGAYNSNSNITDVIGNSTTINNSIRFVIKGDASTSPIHYLNYFNHNYN